MNNKSRNQRAPIEQHDTAAWANREKLKHLSLVTKPSEFQIENAKDYVDDNEK